MAGPSKHADELRSTFRRYAEAGRLNGPAEAAIPRDLTGPPTADSRGLSPKAIKFNDRVRAPRVDARREETSPAPGAAHSPSIAPNAT